MVIILVIVVVGAGALAARYALKRSANERNSVERYHHALEVLQKHPESSEAGRKDAGNHRSAPLPKSSAVPTPPAPPTSPVTTRSPMMPTTRTSNPSPAIPEPPPSIRILGRLPSNNQTSRDKELEARAEEARNRFIGNLNRDQVRQNYHYQAQADLTKERSDTLDTKYKPTHQTESHLQDRSINGLNHQDELTYQNRDNHQDEPEHMDMSNYQDEPNSKMLFFDDESLPDTLSLEHSNKTMRKLPLVQVKKRTIAALASVIIALGLVLALISFGGSTKPKSVSVAQDQNATPTNPRQSTVRSNPQQGTIQSNPQAKSSKHPRVITKKTPVSNSNPYSQSNTTGNIQPTSYSMFSGTYPAPPGNYTVTLSLGEKCWVMAKSLTTGNVLWTGMTYPGQQQSISANGSITIELGAAFQMVVTIAGKSLSFPANYSSPFTMTINPV
ncbi:MAG: DUF4115 domain-containing protein [Actinobacteria bacterium]|nr:DUF4115 domain-containing protein [Actinomycetota bacterium]